MISISAYRASIGGFYSTTQKISSRTTSNISHSDLSGNVCIQHQFIQYLKLCIIREIMPCWIQYFEFFANTNVDDLLLLGGDIERNPGPNTEYNEAQPAKLVNGGTNTCFANSTLQLLNSIPAFKTAVSNTNYPTLPDFLLDRSLQSIIERMRHSFQGNLNCHNDIRRIMTYIPSMQSGFGRPQDAQEFLCYILDQTTNNQIRELFKISINEKVACYSQQCQNRSCSEKSEFHNMFSLPLNAQNIVNSIGDLLLSVYSKSEQLDNYECRNDENSVGCTQRTTCRKTERI